MSHRYSIYGVAVDADWPLAFPPLGETARPVTSVRFTDPADSDFNGVECPPDALASWFHSRLLDGGSAYARWRGLYEFRVNADGSRVACRPLDGCDRGVLQNFLFGQAMAFALVLQGLEPLHAAAVRVGNAAIGFLGDCTHGKSTLVASFVAAGYRLVTDDLLLVSDCGGLAMAAPGAGRIKLHDDSAERFLGPGAAGELLNPLTPKRSYRLPDTQTEREPLPLTHLFVLPTPMERKTASTLSIVPMTRTHVLRTILASSLNVHVLTRARLNRQFAHAAWLASDVKGLRLQYPEGLPHVAAVRDRVLDFVEPQRLASRRDLQ